MTGNKNEKSLLMTGNKNEKSLLMTGNKSKKSQLIFRQAKANTLLSWAKQ
jgi:hypothetical protein